MSVSIMSWVFEHSQTQWGERLVALALADNADDFGRCWPSIARTAHKARVSRSTVKRATAQMVELGELTVTDRGRKTNFYRFTCGLNVTPEDELSPQDVGSPTVPRPDVVGSSATVCGTTHEPLNHQEPSVRTEPSDGASHPLTLSGEQDEKKPKRATRLPDPYPFDEKHIEYALKGGYTREEGGRHFAKFKAHHYAKGDRMFSWYHAWCYWLRNEADFEEQRRLRVVR